MFDTTTPLPTRLNALPPVPERLVLAWRNLRYLDLEPEVRSALERLLARSDPSLGQRVVRWLIQKVEGVGQ